MAGSRCTMDIIQTKPGTSSEEMEVQEDEGDLDKLSDLPVNRKLLADFRDSFSTNTEDRMKVYLRIRPFSHDELDKGEKQECMTVETDTTILTSAPPESHAFKSAVRSRSSKYTFSKIFDESTTQKEFFNKTMLGLVKDFIDGQNCLVFSYGVTNSGKTYTIQGNPKDAGMLPRTLDVIFNSVQGRQWEKMNLKPKLFTNVKWLNTEEELLEKKIKQKVFKLSSDEDIDVTSLLGDDASDISTANTTASSDLSTISSVSSLRSPRATDYPPDDKALFEELDNRIREETTVDVEDQGRIKFSIWVSFAEIYNEQIYDLLEPLPKKKEARRACLKLKEDQNGSPYISGLKEINVTSADEAYKLLTIGQRNLKTACTKMNHHSSRSHCIFNIKIIRVMDKADPRVSRVSMLSLCDLAGSERYTKTQTKGERLKEAGNINTSLLTLGRCIEALRLTQKNKDAHRIVPFRESKLTRLFQNFFVGQGTAAMIVNVSQCASTFDETQQVFRFSAKATKVVTVQKPIFIKPKFPIPNSPLPITRESISWATPGEAVDLPVAANLKLPEDNDLEEAEDNDQEDEIYTRADIDELLGVIESVHAELERVNKSKEKIEARIRREVCREMQQQFQEIEEACSERIRTYEQITEDKYEKKIQLVKDVERAKRQKLEKMVDGDDEWVSSVLLHAEKVKVERQAEKIETLEKELDTLKYQVADLESLKSQVTELQAGHDRLEQETSQLQEEKSQLQEEKSQLHKETSQLQEEKSQLQEETSQLQEEKSQLQEEKSQLQEEIRKLQGSPSTNSTSEQKAADSSTADAIEYLHHKLEVTNNTVQEQVREISELNDMLTEAGETFEQKESELNKLKVLLQEYEEKLEAQGKAIRILETAAKDSVVAVETANQSLSKREECVSTLQSEIQELKEDVHKYRNKAGFFESALLEREQEVLSWKQKWEHDREEHASNQTALIHGFTAEISSLKSQINHFKFQSLRSPTKSPAPTSHTCITGTPTSNKAGSPVKEVKRSDMSSRLRELQQEMDRNSAAFAELEQALQLSRAATEDVEKKLAVETENHGQAKNRIEELERELEKAKSLYLLHRQKGDSTSEDTEEPKMEPGDSKLLISQVAELEKASGRIKELEQQLEDSICQVQSLSQERQKIEELKGEIQRQAEEISTYKSKVTELESVAQELKKCLSGKDTEIERLEERHEELEILNKELKNMVNITTNKVQESIIVEDTPPLPTATPITGKTRKGSLLHTAATPCRNRKGNASVVTPAGLLTSGKFVTPVSSRSNSVVLETPVAGEHRELQMQYMNLWLEASKLKAELKERNTHFSDLSFCINEKEIENRDLQIAQEEQAKKLESLEKALNDKVEDLARTGEELAIATRDRARMQRLCTEVEAMLKEKEQEVTEIQAEKQKLETILTQEEQERRKEDNFLTPNRREDSFVVQRDREVTDIKEKLQSAILEKEDIARELTQKLNKAETWNRDLSAEITKLKQLSGQKDVQLNEMSEKLSKSVADMHSKSCGGGSDEGVQQEIFTLRESLELKSKEIKTLTENLDTKGEEVKLLTEKLESKMKEIKIFKSNLDAKSEEIKMSEKEMKAKTEEIKVLTEKLESKSEEIRMSQQEVESKNQENKILAENLQAKGEEVETLKQNMEAKSEEIKILTENLDAVLEEQEKNENHPKTRKMRKASEKSDKKSQNHTSEGRLGNETIQKLENEIKTLKAKMKKEDTDTIITDLESAVTDKEMELCKKDEELEQLKTDLKNLKSELETSRNDLKHLDSERDELKTSQELQTLKLNQCQLEHTEVRERVKELELQLKDSEEKLVLVTGDFNSQTTEMGRRVEELQSLVSEKEKQLELKCNHLSEQTKELAEVKGELEEKLTELQEMISSKHEIEKQLRELEENKDRLGNTLIEIAELKASVHTHKTLHHNEKGEKEEALLELQTCRNEINTLKQQLEELKKEEHGLEKDRSECQRVVRETEEKLDRLKIEKEEELKTLLQKMEILKSEKQCEIETLLEQMDILKKEKEEEYRKVIENMKHVETEKDQEIGKLLQQIIVLKSENEKQVTEYKDKMDLLQHKMKHDKERLEQFESGTDKNKKDFAILQEEMDQQKLMHEKEVENFQKKILLLTNEHENNMSVVEERLRILRTEKENECDRLDCAVKELQCDLEHKQQDWSSEREELRIKFQQDIETLKSNVDKGTVRITQLESEIEQLNREKDDLLKDKEHLEKNMKTTVEEMTELKEEKSTLQLQLNTESEKLRLLLSEAEKNLKNEENRYQTMISKYADIEKECQKLREQSSCTKTHSGDIDELQRLYEAEKLKNEQYKEMINETNEQDCFSPQTNVRRLRKEKIEAENSLIEAKYQMKMLENELRDLKTSEKQTEGYQKNSESCIPSHDPLLQRKLNKTTSRLHEVEANNRKLIQEVVVLQTTIETLEKEKSERQEADNDPSSKSRVSVTGSRSSRRSMVSDTTHLELKRSKERIEELKEQLMKSSNSILDWSQKFDGEKNRRQELETSLQKANTRIQQLEGSHSEEKRSEDKFKSLEKISDLELQLVVKQQEIERKSGAVYELQRQTENQLRRIQELEKDKTSLDNIVALLKESLAEQDTMLQEMDELTRQKDEEISDLKSEHQTAVEKLQNEMKQLQSVLESSRQQTDNTTAKSSENKLTGLKQKIKEQTTLISSLEKALADKEAEMKRWRSEKDKLVSSFEVLLTKKTIEIQQLQEKELQMMKNIQAERQQMAITQINQQQNSLPVIKLEQQDEEEVHPHFHVRTAEKEHHKRTNSSVKRVRSRAKTASVSSEVEEPVFDSQSQDSVHMHSPVKSPVEEKQKRTHSTTKRRRRPKNTSNSTEVEGTENNEESLAAVEATSPVLTSPLHSPPTSDRIPVSRESSTRKQSSTRRHRPDSSAPDSRTVLLEGADVTGDCLTDDTPRGRKRTSMDHLDILPPLPKRVSKGSMMSDSDDISGHLQMDVTPAVAAKTLRKTRKKMGSVTNLQQSDEMGETKPMRRSKRSARSRILESFKESPIGRQGKRLLENISEVLSPKSPTKDSPGLSRSGSNKSRASSSKENENINISETTEQVEKKSDRRRHKLYKEDNAFISEPLECTGQFVEHEDVHKKVTRSLRSRRH